mmetsp:Transcript_5264/g.16525  ORF Transcript_5264/g.16525 Transcript_5264/m.16525 type:complete len:218 (-) Transcript_5264:589-1242(-)
MRAGRPNVSTWAGAAERLDRRRGLLPADLAPVWAGRGGDGDRAAVGDESYGLIPSNPAVLRGDGRGDRLARRRLHARLLVVGRVGSVHLLLHGQHHGGGLRIALYDARAYGVHILRTRRYYGPEPRRARDHDQELPQVSLFPSRRVAGTRRFRADNHHRHHAESRVKLPFAAGLGVRVLLGGGDEQPTRPGRLVWNLPHLYWAAASRDRTHHGPGPE